MKIYVKSSESILESSFNRARAHMNRELCAFITAFRDSDESGNPYSLKEKRQRNKELEREIKSSGLTYVKAKGGFIENAGTSNAVRVEEETFCVINNRYAPNDFIKLAIHWCGMFDQDAVLVTEPNPIRRSDGHPDAGKPIDIIGRYYDKHGNVEMEFHNASVKDAEEFFTNLYGKDFVLSSTDIHATESRQIYSVSGRVMAARDFKCKYPELVDIEE